MIVGMAIECIDVERFAGLLASHGERLRKRLFTGEELAYAARGEGARSLAVRFAAKVAARRALGLEGGLGGFRDVEILRESGKAPRLALSGSAARTAQERAVTQSWLSLTHDRRLAIGQVLFEDRR